MIEWFALVGTEVVGPFSTFDQWYTEHGGPDWRYHEWNRTGHDPWRVARDRLPDGTEVSTVFLGLDHAHWPNAPRQLFETIVLPACDIAARCATWDEAVVQHATVLNEMRERWTTTHKN